MLAKTIRGEIELSEELMQESLKHSVRAGEFLSELKELVPEPKLEEWLRENCKLSLKEAQRLINFSSGAEMSLTAKVEKGKNQEPERRKEQK